MGKFNAKTAVEAMEYDFTAFGGPEGTIPEPSREQVDDYFGTVRKLQDWIRGKVHGIKDAISEDGEVDVEKIDADKMANFLAGMTDEEYKEHSAEIVNAVAALCSNEPSVEDLRRLPYRVQQAFNAWLTGELNPKKAAATSH